MGLQETFKKDFTNNELVALTGCDKFGWNWVFALGHSGGILLGVNRDVLDIEGYDQGRYFVSTV